MKKITLILIVLLGVVFCSVEALAKFEELKGVKKIWISVGDIESGYGFTKDDVKKHVYLYLKSKLPSVKIHTESVLPYIYVSINLHKEGDWAIGNINFDFYRDVVLPDKTTYLFASVLHQDAMFANKIDKVYSTIKKMLDKMLDDFAYDYLKAQEKIKTNEEVNKLLEERRKSRN